MTYTRSGLGEIAGLGMIRIVEDLLIEGERLAEEKRIGQEALEKEKKYQTERKNQAFVEKTDTEHVVRLENEIIWTHAYASNDDYSIGHGIGHHMFYTSIIEQMFPDIQIKKHMLLNISTIAKEGYKAIEFTYDPESYGGNVYFSKRSGSVWPHCFGTGYELILQTIGLEDNKPKKAWLKLSENKDIANML
jgi:hypothetical protein